MMNEAIEKSPRAAQLDEIYSSATERGVFARALFAENLRLLRFTIPEGSSILEIGCGTGEMLKELKPARGVGIDLSQVAITKAKEACPDLEFYCGDAAATLSVEEKFDFILLNFTVGDLEDVWSVFRNLRRHCGVHTRIVITYYNFLWEPLVKLSSAMGLRRKWREQSWFSLEDISNLLDLNGFQIIHKGTRTLCPMPIPPLSWLANRYLAGLPVLQHFNLITFCVARFTDCESETLAEPPSVSVIIPTRNERGNIRDAVERTPAFPGRCELIFVDGDSNDGTVEEIEKCIAEFGGERAIRLIHQVPRNSGENTGKMLKLGKGDAVRKGFDAAEGDILMILDSDLTMPPEELPKFYAAIAENRAEFINGNRLSYPMENQAMRFLNLVANRMFGIIFTWLLGQRIKDTLCGTKVLRRSDYQKIAANRAFFGDFDPFGDFDLLFGAAKLNLKISDLPVRYRARTYGEVKIERFKHGILLVKMCFYAFGRFKIF